MPPSSSTAVAAAPLLFLIVVTTGGLLPSTAALTLPPNLIGDVSISNRHDQKLRSSSVTLTIDDEDPSGLWHVLKKLPPKSRRVGFNFLRADGPVPRGGSGNDITPLPVASSASVAVDNEKRSFTPNHVLRATLRGIRRNIISIHSAISISTGGSSKQRPSSSNIFLPSITPPNIFDGLQHHFHLKNIRRRKCTSETQQSIADAYSAAAAVMMEKTTMEKDGFATASALFDVKKTVITARGGDSSTTATLPSPPSPSYSLARSSPPHQKEEEEATFIIETPLFPIILPKSWEAPFKGTSSYYSRSSSSTTTSSKTYMASLEITIAPPEDIITSSSSSSTTTPTQHQLHSATLPLIPKTTWISGFSGQEFFYPQTYNGLVNTGLLMGSRVKSAEYVTWASDKKTEKFLKEFDDGSIDDGEKNEKKKKSWYDALDSTQEVLVWSGKFIDNNNDSYGADLPIIKTTSIIHKPPKYLAELLMDSTKVKSYNKMSLGRDDVHVFQTGVDADTTATASAMERVEGGGRGQFGNVGESKIVRNLTRPPMVNSNLEFVTCMHARKLTQQDLQVLSSNNNDPKTPTSGYIVVSRAVTGGQWNSSSDSSSKNVRNEIILGVNILLEVPDQPNKTELIAITHVYSPLIPLMLAKNAGVKGAVDFVRDIRSLP